MTKCQLGAIGVPQVRITQFDSWDEICPAWDDLLGESSSRSAFLTYEWLGSWWRIYAGSGELLLLGCVTGEGRLVGVAPLYRQSRQALFRLPLRVLRLVGDGSHDSDNLDMVVRPGYEIAAVRALLDWLTGQRADWDVLELNTVPSRSPVAAALTRELTKRQWPCVEEESPHLVLSLPGDWDTYLRSLSTNMRTSIVSRTKRLRGRFDVCLRRCQSEDELPAALDRLFELHNMRWRLRGEPGTFSVSQRRSFYRDLARQFLSRGWLHFWLLDLDGQTVAAEFGFCHGPTYSFLQGGFDPAYAAHSVGLVLRALMLQQLIRQGVRHYDFLGGDAPHKVRWGAEQHTYLHIRCAIPRSRGALYLAAIQSSAKGKEWLRTRLPAGVWALLRQTYRRFTPTHGPVQEEA